MYEKKLIILAQGDSIKDGNRARINLDDYNHVLGHGYVQMAAGMLGSEFPGRGIYFVNRGVSGDNIDQMTARWQKDCLDIHPDILSIFIGVNQADEIHYEAKMRFLLEQTFAITGRIMLIQPVSLILTENEQEISRQRAVCAEQEIISKLCLEYKLLELKTGDLLRSALAEYDQPRYWLWDGIHPTPAFHNRIAQEYVNLLKKSGWLESCAQ